MKIDRLYRWALGTLISMTLLTSHSQSLRAGTVSLISNPTIYGVGAYATDAFTGTGDLDTHTMDTGSGWTEVSGVWAVGGGVATQSGAAGTYLATTNLGVSDYRLHLEVGSVGAGAWQGGPIFRYTDANNYWHVIVHDGNNTAYLQKTEAGVVTTIDAVAITIAAQQFYSVDIWLSGDEISVFVDGGYPIVANNSFNQSATLAGLTEFRDGSNGSTKFDFFQAVAHPVYPLTFIGTVLEQGGTTDQDNAQEATVLLDGNAQILSGTVFKMWYTAGWSSVAIHYAESIDGIAWTQYGSNPVLSGFQHSHIVKDGNTYYLYARNASTGQKDLYTSSNGLSWTLDTANVIPLGAGGSWDDAAQGNTFVWKEGTIWYALYDAHNGDGHWYMGLATSTAPGGTWTKSGSNPVLTTTGMVGGMWVAKINNYYYAWVHHGKHSNIPTFIARYRSLDLVTWETYPFGFEIQRIGVDQGVNSASGQVADPFIVKVGNTAYIFYEATADGNNASGHMHILLATMDYRGVSGY